ncbi:MAG: sigma-70 family RNA polymerase sigma factor [Synergistales bacterium]|nr:sigma-70 family RNA polymerase sigma factor [Bacteroidales bacterium]MDY6434958.1 sigma-70 family RNA polymerase sigma factor [Synergistales bacterium]MDY6394327.1 sigma-70 family RNA polymerase sigma factor [Bacteroidales bacterium]MDY6395742.1 sigma-70 family RNA polymerase sigma factor [Bacteroidales bacterium]MDY6402894.1 sigma-70 family RNA polymerase sigma factor [Bacteroidales bacterium]
MQDYGTNNQDFENIYRTYYRKMFGICVSYVHDQAIAEDLLQDAFIIVINKLPTLRDKTKLEPWISTIVKNTCVNYLRKKSLFSNISVDIEQQKDDIDDNVRQEEDTISYSTLMNMVEQLPDGYKKVFKLAVFEGYTHEEIAKLLDISPKTSSSQLSRAKKTLKSMILSYWSLALVSVVVFVSVLFALFLNKPLNDRNVLREESFSATIKQKTIEKNNIVNINKINKINKNFNIIEEEKDVNIFVGDTNRIKSDLEEEGSVEYAKEEKVDFIKETPFGRDIIYNNTYTKKMDDKLISFNFSFIPINQEFSAILSSMDDELLVSWNMENSIDLNIEKMYYKPISFNLIFEKAINRRFSAGLGLVYTFLRTEYLFEDEKIRTDNVQYLGFKSQVAFHYYKNSRVDSYIALGGVAELPVYHKTRLYFTEKTVKENLNAHCQFYGEISLGFSINVGYGINVFAEPCLDYFFENKDDFETFRTKHRWDFNVPIGVRIKL